MKYLITDCEMGGREIKYSLLTTYFLVVDEFFRQLGELDLKVKPDDGDYILSGQGMAVNKINLQEHDRIAIPYKQAKPLVYNFLKTQSGGEKLVPVGHGVKGDIEHIIKNLISPGSWEQYCTYHYLDTSVILQFLRACGKMPMDCDGSVGALARYFNFGDFEEHVAKEDTRANLFILQQFIKLGKTNIPQ